MVKHIGIQVKEEDLGPFYKRVLNGKEIRAFEINSERSGEVFGIPAKTFVTLMEIEDTTLELFVHETVAPLNYNHICLQTEAAEKYADAAQKEGYRVMCSQSGTVGTWFIYDNNGNMFEIKNFGNEHF